MAANEAEWASIPKIDAAAYFAKLGLTRADVRPILEGLRQANADWRRERRQRIADHARRVQEHLRRFQRPWPGISAPSRARMGKPRAVWCVELRRHFRSLTEAAAFVNRKPCHISQSLLRGVRCGPYHWEDFDRRKHCLTKSQLRMPDTILGRVASPISAKSAIVEQKKRTCPPP